ncbi:MAG: hypothetical protein AAFV53_16990 [Myxococcota bacterium]
MTLIKKIDPWMAGILGAFAVLVGVYVVFISLALEQPLQIEPSYIETPR